MSFSREDQTPDIENQIIDERKPHNHLKCIDVPVSSYNGWIWNKKVVSVNKNNMAEILLELERAEKELEGKINNAEYAGKMIIRSGALLIALLQILKESFNQVQGTPFNQTSIFNVTINAICLSISPVTAFIAEIVTHIKANAEEFKNDSKKCQSQLRPR